MLPAIGASGPAAVAGFVDARRRFHAYRRGADLVRTAGLALGFAALTGVAAQVRVPLPFSPVPVTGQTFAVLLCGIALGWRGGGLSQGLYAALGAAGVPWFTGMAGGIGTLLGPTGGYILGFVVAAVAVGWAVDRGHARRLPALVAALLLANFVVIHGLGLVGLWLWLAVATGADPTAMEVLTMGSLPFVPGDLVKLAAAVAVGRAVAPRGPGAGAEGPESPDA